ncbi:MAG: hypothetical protein PHD13_00050 [Methanocellales archaeon]|nr:hypothetical protein [Methanocellales archaeon]MDD3291826.1 hypothetical protein [Methanocellales archaeon]MDD5234560.1 hypothetical protein [Methanocellales archaeon]MDD5485087.1 hypothetical protein [Methanocellales archaeon]
MMQEKIELDYKELIKRAQEQPGIKELMIVYGDYESMIQQSHEYLMGMMPLPIISSNNNSSY